MLPVLALHCSVKPVWVTDDAARVATTPGAVWAGGEADVLIKPPFANLINGPFAPIRKSDIKFSGNSLYLLVGRR